MLGNLSCETAEQGCIHAGLITVRRGIAMVQAANRPSVEGEGRDGKRPDKIFPIDRQEAEEGSEIAIGEEGRACFGYDSEEGFLVDDVQAIPQDL